MIGEALEPQKQITTVASPRSRVGFTLVELLVVVALIAMLVSILLPSLNAARQRAKQVTCASRLRQWGIALQFYANENNDYWPHCDALDRQDPDPQDPDLIPSDASPEDVADWHGWVDKLPPLLKRTGWRYYEKYHFPDETTFYQCPMGGLVSGAKYDYKPRKFGYFSYAMNSCLVLDLNCWPPPDKIDWPMPSFLKVTKIFGPAKVFVLYDQLLDSARGYGGDITYDSAGKHCGGYPIAFAARHWHSRQELGGNILHADGHVDWYATVWKHEWGDWDIGGQQAPPREDRNWYPYPVEPEDE